MESTFNNFESNTDFMLAEDQQTGFTTQTPGFPGGEDEDGDDEEDTSTGSGDDNPPIDDDVVHSPVPTQPGKPAGK